MTNLNNNWNYPTSIWFGENKIQALPKALKELNIKNPLFITDPNFAKLDIMQNVCKILDDHHIEHGIFTDIKPNPVAKNITDGAKEFFDNKHDGIIAIGGGSALDSAKTIAICAYQLIHTECDLWDFEDVGDNFKRIASDKIIPLIAVPTTAGTGSEVGRAAVIIDEDKKQKRFIFHPEMTPNLVIADPALTLKLPAHLTAATGMDALAHNLEAYCAPGYHPIADGIAVEGIRLIKENLSIAYQDGSDITARSNLMAASIMGGSAFQKGLGAVHSLSHPVGAIYDFHHGLLNAIFMPYVLIFNKDKIKDKIIRLAKYLDLKDASFDGFLNWLIDLCKEINIPNKLSDLNIDASAEDIDNIIKQALVDPSTSGNPRELSKEDFHKIFNNALHGIYVEA